MSVFKSIFMFSLMCLFVIPIFAETPTESLLPLDLEKYRTGASIGINDLPWDASGVSFRWWRENGRGRELIINRSYIRYSRAESTEEDSLEIEIDGTTRDKYINIPEITYSFLNRKAMGAKGIYLVKGIGIGAGFRISLEDSYTPESDIIRENKYYAGNLTLHFPIGIEHFFLEKYSNISYSLNADIYGTISFYNRKNRTEYPDSYPYSISTDNIWDIQTSFGISPVFYIRAYF